jgi:hypothetical protein
VRAARSRWRRTARRSNTSGVITSLCASGLSLPSVHRGA